MPRRPRSTKACRRVCPRRGEVPGRHRGAERQDGNRQAEEADNGLGVPQAIPSTEHHQVQEHATHSARSQHPGRARGGSSQTYGSHHYPRRGADTRQATPRKAQGQAGQGHEDAARCIWIIINGDVPDIIIIIIIIIIAAGPDIIIGR